MKKTIVIMAVALVATGGVFAQQLQAPVWIPIKGKWTEPVERAFRGLHPAEGKEFEGYLAVDKSANISVLFLTTEAAQAVKEKLAAYDTEMARYTEAKAAYDAAKAEAKAAKTKFTEKAPAKPKAPPASAQKLWRWNLGQIPYNGAQEAVVRSKPQVYFLWAEDDGSEVQYPVRHDEYNQDGSFGRTVTDYIFCRSGNVKLYQNGDGSFASVTSTVVAYQRGTNGQFRNKAGARAILVYAQNGGQKTITINGYNGPVTACFEAAVTGPAVYKKPAGL